MPHNQNIVNHSELFAGWSINLGGRLSNPDYALTFNAETGLPASVNNAYYITPSVTDPKDAGNQVIRANYHPEGLQAAGHCWSELTLGLPINAVQVHLKFSEFTPATYTVANASNHKSVGFHSGPYGVVNSNITVTSECWPSVGGATPSIYTGHDGINYGHHHPSPGSEPLLWLEGDDTWHEVEVLLELAPSPGQFGRYRMWRNGLLIIDSENLDWMNSNRDATAKDHLGYATRGNFIDDVRLFGWANSDDGINPAFTGNMHFLYDNVELYANATFKTINEG